MGDVILLDDGLQHRSLFRNVDIICIDVSSPEAVESFIEGHLLPAGRLRENRDKALLRADAIILSHRKPKEKAFSLAPELLRLIPKKVPYVESFYEVDGVFSLSTRDRLSPQRVIAFSAIANPEGFISSLQAAGFDVITHHCLRDHKTFPIDFLRSLNNQNPTIPLVCTEKDAVKLLQKSDLPIYELRVSAILSIPVEDFIEQILPENIE